MCEQSVSNDPTEHNHPSANCVTLGSKSKVVSVDTFLLSVQSSRSKRLKKKQPVFSKIAQAKKRVSFLSQEHLTV